MTDGRAALARGDWQGAKQAFERSLQQGDDPEADLFDTYLGTRS